MSSHVVSELDNSVKVMQIYVACTLAIIIWEWLACLPQEYKFIWKADWSPIKCLYFSTRYYTLCVLIVNYIWFYGSWSEKSCAHNIRILPGIAVLIDFSVETVLALRAFAICGRNHRIGVFLCVILVGFLAVMIAVPIAAFTYVKLDSWPGPCLVDGKQSVFGPKFIIAFYASPMFVDMVVTILTIRQGVLHRKAGVSSDLIRVFIRDGVFYFVAITAFNLINVIFFVRANRYIQSINAPMSIHLSTVLCCRLILNLRAANAQKASIRRFSGTLNRWVDEFTIEDKDESPLRWNTSMPLPAGQGPRPTSLCVSSSLSPPKRRPSDQTLVAQWSPNEPHVRSLTDCSDMSQEEH